EAAAPQRRNPIGTVTHNATFIWCDLYGAANGFPRRRQALRTKHLCFALQNMPARIRYLGAGRWLPRILGHRGPDPVLFCLRLAFPEAQRAKCASAWPLVAPITIQRQTSATQ